MWHFYIKWKNIRTIYFIVLFVVFQKSTIDKMFKLTFGLVAIILSAVSLLIQMFSLVTLYWMYTPLDDDDDYITFLGLWQVCFTKEWRKGDVHVCQTPKFSKSRYHWILSTFAYKGDNYSLYCWLIPFSKGV